MRVSVLRFVTSLSIAAMAALSPMVAAAAPAAEPGPAGSYAIEGSCPSDANPYRGTLAVAPAGPFYALTWQVAGEVILGTALERDGQMTIEFRFASGASGLMEMRRTNGGWRGTWAVYGGSVLCEERWAPR